MLETRKNPKTLFVFRNWPLSVRKLLEGNIFSSESFFTITRSNFRWRISFTDSGRKSLHNHWLCIGNFSVNNVFTFIKQLLLRVFLRDVTVLISTAIILYMPWLFAKQFGKIIQIGTNINNIDVDCRCFLGYFNVYVFLHKNT